MATFQDRLNAAMGERGYSSMMRRSVQTVFLYEAHRCLKDKLPSLRPFQRKLAVFDQAIYLVNDSSLLPQQREEVLYKKVMSKELMDPETMWRRVRNVVSEVKKVAEQVQPLCTKKKTHLEVYYSFLQKNYNEAQGKNGELYPARWEFTHNHNFLAYKMYYNKGNLDTTFPPPTPREIIVPAKKPPGGVASYGAVVSTELPANVPRPGSTIGGREGTGGVPADSVARTTQVTGPAHSSAPGSRTTTSAAGRASQDGPGSLNLPPEVRREVLKEVREHMELLRSFEGIVDDDVLRQRKRELFDAMPPAPPSIHSVMLASPAVPPITQAPHVAAVGVSTSGELKAATTDAAIAKEGQGVTKDDDVTPTEEAGAAVEESFSRVQNVEMPLLEDDAAAATAPVVGAGTTATAAVTLPGNEDDDDDDEDEGGESSDEMS